MEMQEDSTVRRLQKERDLLKGSLQFLQAAVALEGLSSSGDASSPPAGGPD